MKTMMFAVTLSLSLALASFVWAGDCHPLLQCPAEPPLPAVFFQERVLLPPVAPFERTRARIRHGLHCLPAVTVASSESELLPWISQVDHHYFIVNAFSFGRDRGRWEALVTYWCPED